MWGGVFQLDPRGTGGGGGGPWGGGGGGGGGFKGVGSRV